jgi:hypothetical protein
MTDTDDPQHRVYHQPDADQVTVREEVDEEDGVMTVRMPLASTGEVRNNGDEPLTREELEGMARQINSGGEPTFLDHGSNMELGGSRYSAVGKIGEWREADVEHEAGDDGSDLLMADTRMMDPETLPAATGSLREALAAIKSQVERDMTLSSSIGWRDDESFPGGVDLMEASIVGIPADPRTTSQSAAEAMARAAVGNRPDADAEQLVDAFRAVVMGPDSEERHLSDQQAETAEQLVNAYRDEQGDGSVENFESWLWSVARHQFDDNEFHAAHTALEEYFRETTPLDEPVSDRFMPFLTDRDGGDEGSDARDSVTDPDNDPSGDDPDDTQDGQDDMTDAEYRENMLEMQRQQTETLSALADALREDGDDEDDEDDDEDDDGGDTQSLTVDGEEFTADDVRQLHEGLDDADPDTETDEDRDANDTDDQPANPQELL